VFDRFRSPRFRRSFSIVSGLVLVAGVVAFGVSRLGGNVDPVDPAPAPNAPPASVPEEEATKATSADQVPVEARRVAGEFILAAAGREDLRKAWQITHPDLKAQCQCTLKQWLTGDIPVQPYPVDDLETATFDSAEISKNQVYMRVALLPKKGSAVKAQVFFIGLKAAGTGQKKTWLVDYWAPYSTIPVPAAG
jgi:hypothetical protein